MNAAIRAALEAASAKPRGRYRRRGTYRMAWPPRSEDVEIREVYRAHVDCLGIARNAAEEALASAPKRVPRHYAFALYWTDFHRAN